MQVLRSSPHLRWTARSSAPVIVSSRAQGLTLSALLWVTPRSVTFAAITIVADRRRGAVGQVRTESLAGRAVGQCGTCSVLNCVYCKNYGSQYLESVRHIDGTGQRHRRGRAIELVDTGYR